MDITEYLGSWSRPLNFDSYWDKKLEFINSVPLDYELTEVEFSNFDNVKYYDLYFTSFDGARIYAKW